MAKIAAKKAMLTIDMDQKEALQLVASGAVAPEAYEEWDADRQKRLNKGKKGSNNRATRTERQMDNDEFLKNAKAISLNIDGQVIVLQPRSFSSGSVGWGYSGKVTIDVNDTPLKVQGSINLAVVGSKG